VEAILGGSKATLRPKAISVLVGPEEVARSV
jgi:hypothetical protein